MIVCVSRSSWRTAVEKTSTSVRLAAAASSWPRCSVRFSKWASFVSLHQQHTFSTLCVLLLVVRLHRTTSFAHNIFRISTHTVWEIAHGLLYPQTCIYLCAQKYKPPYTHTHEYTHSIPVSMKAAIMFSNCAARSSLFSDAPRPHWAPFSLIYCLWEAHCTEKEMLCPRPLQIDVPFSFVFTCLNGRIGLHSTPDWPLLLPVGRETEFLAQFKLICPFHLLMSFCSWRI